MSSWQKISVRQVESLRSELDLLVLDMRDKYSFLKDHHPDALHLDTNNLRLFLKHTDRYLPILIYCSHGHNSQDMAQLFADFGFTNCYSLEGGYEAWNQSLTKPIQQLPDELVNWLEDMAFSSVNLDQRGKNNETALMCAAQHGQHKFCRQIIEAGASVNLVNADGNNALWIAAHVDASDIVHTLIHAGVDIDNQNDNGATVLMYAAATGKQWLLNTLLRHGADLKLSTRDGFTALDVVNDIRVYKLLRGFPQPLWSSMPTLASA